MVPSLRGNETGSKLAGCAPAGNGDVACRMDVTLASGTLTHMLKEAACHPKPVEFRHFNSRDQISYEVTIEQVCYEINKFIRFLGFINQKSNRKQIPRLEAMLMPANVSSVVGDVLLPIVSVFIS